MRQDTPNSNDPVQQDNYQNQEYNNTRDKRWERLPQGVSIDQITTPEAILKSITGGFASLAKANSKPAAASILKWSKYANQADDLGDFKYADKLDYIIRCLHI